jgi:hypothetical protein
MEECKFEGCEKPVKVQKTGLCSGHYQQQLRGIELKELLPRKLSTPVPCSHDGCARRANRRYQDLCKVHFDAKPAVPEGIDPKAMNEGKGFSTDRYCAECTQVVNWRKYHLDVGMCSKCWRSHLSALAK